MRVENAADGGTTKAVARRDRPSIAAIIPFYNRAKWIERAIDSVLSQTLVPDEVIVVDDGSTDGGAEIVATIAAASPRVTLIRKPNGGPSSARNVGIRHSSSDLIALLDSDDVWHPTHLEELVQPFLEPAIPPLGWVYSDLDEYDGDGRLNAAKLLHLLDGGHPKASLRDCLGCNMFVFPSTSMFTRPAFDAIGGFDESLHGYEDDDFFLRLFAAGYGSAYIDKSLCDRHKHAGSISSGSMSSARLIYLDKLFAMFPDRPDLGRFPIRDTVAPRFIRDSVHCFYLGVRTADKKMHAEAIRELRALLPWCRRRDRVLLLMAIAFLRSYELSRVAYKLRLFRFGSHVFELIWRAPSRHYGGKIREMSDCASPRVS